MTKIKLFPACWLLFCGLACTAAFAPTKGNHVSFTSTRSTPFSKSQLCMSSQFDVSKPTFDLFSMRNVRGDALAKYNSLNQSEPLRINIWGLLMLTFFASPLLAEELNGEALPAVGVALASLAGVGTGALFVRECKRRARQLTRMEKELFALSLQVRLPSNQLADSQYLQARPLQDLLNKSSKTVRVIAVSGKAAQLKESLQKLRVLGRRLAQASAFVIPVPTDGSIRSDWGIATTDRQPWLADAAEPEEWREYFENLSPGDKDEFRWFGISAVGRSFGSGKGQNPEWLQILGQHLRPTDLLDADDPSQTDVQGVLAQQGRFYRALTEGNLSDMHAVCSPEISSKVSAVMTEGGRMDEWKACLAEGARPEGMQLADADVVVVSDTLAYSTIIEFPVTPGLEEATLLAVQTWERTSSQDEWKLSLHETIPWSADRPAGGILLCDCRGCVALTRAPDRVSFRGMLS